MSETTRTNTAPSLLRKSRLVEQVSGGPTLHQVAAQFLRKALINSFPEQQLDPDKTMLMSPIWFQQDEEIISTSSRFESLTHALIRIAFTQAPANYIEGEHFLTLMPHAAEPIHLPVSMDFITTLLNEYAASMFIGFQQSQLDYWNETTDNSPRRQVVADTLKKALDVQSATGWDEDECSLGRLVSQNPDQALRPASSSGLSNVRACLLDLDLAVEPAKGNSTRHLMIGGALVLTATVGSRELIVLYTIADGYESFSSMAQLGASLPARIGVDLSGLRLKWRLYEPEGDIFDAFVWALVGCQIDSIDALNPASHSPMAGFSSRQDESSAISAADKARVEQLETAIPSWLSASSLDDTQAYSGYLIELGNLRGESGGDAFDANDIPLIQTYAQQQMRDAILADEIVTDAASLHLDDVRITVTQSFEAGGFTLPDPRHIILETLGEFALQNIRPYSATVAYSDGTAVRDWMTVSFLLRIANSINVGEAYPQLIKRTLIDDPVQARRHEDRYRLQLPQLLPMLALECKLKRQGGVDQQGYRQVCQLMESVKSGASSAFWPVQIRPLAFMPHYRLGTTPDIVTNMYVIGPREGSNGPCLLYRPLLDQPLRQFPSEQNMLYTFYQAGELRDSILAWLSTPALSFEYAQYVFSGGMPSPWTITELAFEPFSHLDLTASVGLANTPLSGDIFTTLYSQNSQAIAELADRQSTSNGERRWALLADSGWAIFSVAANFLSGPAGTAVWVWQSISQIQQALDAAERGDTLVEWSSIGDVLLALGILLTQRVANRRIPQSNPYHETADPERVLRDEPTLIAPDSAEHVTVTHDTTPLSAELPEAHLSALAPAGLSRNGTGLLFVKKIDALKVPAPKLPDGTLANAEHLYENQGKLYAQVGTRWFQVSAEADEPVLVVDPGDPSFPGLGVAFDEKTTRWHWDLKLRLRGGGPTSRIEALRRARTQKKDEAWAALNRFIEQEIIQKASVDEVLSAFHPDDVSAPMSDETIASYFLKSDELASGYTQALEQLETWREAGGAGAFYQSQLMRFTIEQHRYLNGWIRMKVHDYVKIIAPQFNPSEPSTTSSRVAQMETAQKAIAVSDEMIDRLGRMHTSLDRLMNHTGVTRKVAGDLKKILPALSPYDLKANEIGMSTELCLREAPDSDLSQARQSIADIFENAADASHSLVERRSTAQPSQTQTLDAERLTDLVDRLAEAEWRLEELSVSLLDQLEPVPFARVQTLVGEFHQLARSRLLKLLPEAEEIPVAQMARLEPVPSTSRAIGKVSKSRPRVLEAQKKPSTETPGTGDEVPIIKTASRRPVQAAALTDQDIIGNGLTLNVELDGFIERIRADAQRPSRVPADMKDLLDQQATRLDQAANDVALIMARRSDFPVGSLSAELRAGAEKTRREGVNLYGAMLIKRRPRETYLKWLMEHDQVLIIKDAHGRIKTKQRKDYFQEYGIFDKTRQNKALWVAHFHYNELTDPDERFTAAHLKFAAGYLKELPAKTRQELDVFDALDNALRRIVDPAIRDLFLKPKPSGTPEA